MLELQHGPGSDLDPMPISCRDQELQLLLKELSSRKMTTVEKNYQHQAHHSSSILSVGFIAVASSKCFYSKMFSISSRTVARIGVRNFKVAVLGASGGIGQPLALLLKLDRNVTELALFDVVKTPGVAADISHCCTPAKVFFCEQLWFQNTI